MNTFTNVAVQTISSATAAAEPTELVRLQEMQGATSALQDSITDLEQAEAAQGHDALTVPDTNSTIDLVLADQALTAEVRIPDAVVDQDADTGLSESWTPSAGGEELQLAKAHVSNVVLTRSGPVTATLGTEYYLDAVAGTLIALAAAIGFTWTVAYDCAEVADGPALDSSADGLNVKLGGAHTDAAHGDHSHTLLHNKVTVLASESLDISINEGGQQLSAEVALGASSGLEIDSGLKVDFAVTASKSSVDAAVLDIADHEGRIDDLEAADGNPTVGDTDSVSLAIASNVITANVEVGAGLKVTPGVGVEVDYDDVASTAVTDALVADMAALEVRQDEVEGYAGDVFGPASAINNQIAVFDGTTGKIVKDGGATVAQLQPIDATLTALAAIVTATDKLIYATGVDSFATTTITAYARTLLDDADAAASLLTLGAASLASPTFTGVPAAPTAAGGTATTQLATTAFVTAAISTAVSGLIELKGSLNCSANPNYPPASTGDAYYVSVAGKIGGSSGKSVDVGDTIIASADNAGGTEASVGTSWFVLEHNLAGALLSANNLSDVVSAGAALTNLGLTANGKSLVAAADYAAMRGLLGLVIGTDVAAQSSLASYLPLAGGTLTGSGIIHGVGGTSARLELTQAGGSFLQYGTSSLGVAGPLLWTDSGIERMRLAADGGLFLSNGPWKFYRTAGDYSTNYERFIITAASGSFTLAAESAGTGADDINLILTPAGAGKVGIGSDTSLTGMLHIVPNAAATKALYIKGAASQTGDAFHYANSSGTALTVVDSSGRIGVGVSPTARVDVSYYPPDNAGTSYAFRSIITGGANNNNIAAYFEATGASSNYALQTVGACSFTGNSTHSGTFDIRGNPSSTLGNLFIGDYGSGGLSAGNGGTIVFAGSTAGQTSADSTFAYIKGVKSNSTYLDAAGALVFGTQTSGSNGAVLSTVTEKVRITEAGLVGIGTASPSFRLDIGGGDGSYLNAFRAGYALIGGHSGTDYDSIGYNTKPTTSGGVYNYTWSDTACRIQFHAGGFRFITAASGTAGNPITETERFRITQAGNVGIGTSSPSYPLHVNGTIHTDGVLHLGGNACTISPSSSSGFLDFNSNQGIKINPGGAFSTHFTSAGLVGIGIASPTAQLHIVPNAASTVGVLVKGAASQSANYLEIVDSSSVNVFKIDSAGVITGTGGESPLNFSHTSHQRSTFAVNSTVTSHHPEVLFERKRSGSYDVDSGDCMGGITCNTVSFFRGKATADVASGYSTVDWVWEMYNAAGVTAERMRFTAEGQLGIGTASPAEKLTVASGNICIATEGYGLNIKEGSNARMGIATLVAGTAVVTTTAVTANSRIFLEGQDLGTITVPVGYAVSARTAGTSFTILSANIVDTSQVAWTIMEPA